MPTLPERLQWLYNGTDTTRMHGRRMLEPQRVGQHSHRLALLLLVLYNTDPVMQSVQDRYLLLRYAALHDLAEHMGTVGDIPTPAKRQHGLGATYEAYEQEQIENYAGFEASLPEHLHHRFKVVDCLDGLMTCVRERQLGNTTLEDMYDNYHGYLVEMQLQGAEKKLFDAVHQLWRQANDVR
jgi:5'-deoxynucleotidase YfbR-like HD superfamily hydrolase